MCRKILIVVAAGASCALFASMHATAQETKLAFAEAKMPPEPNPHRHPVERIIPALIDTARRYDVSQLASFASGGLLSSREMRRMRKKGAARHSAPRIDAKISAMKRKSRK